MAHVFKPVYTKQVPANAERVKHKDGPAVRWRGKGGKWVTALLCDGRPDRCRVEAAAWYVEYSDHEGRTRRKKGYADKGATEALMAELVRQAARIQCGLLPAEAAAPRRTLTELLDRWRDYIAANGAMKKNADRARARVRDICDGIGAARPSDLNPVAVQNWLAEKRAADDHKGYRFGASTSNHYLGAAKQFTRWLAQVDKSEPVDYLSAIKRRSNHTDLRRVRRPLPQDQLDRLIATARHSAEVLYGLTGRERAVLYLTACSTGLRAAELASLTPDSLDLKRGEVTIQAQWAKNKRTDTLPLHAGVVRELRQFLKGHPGGPLWPNRRSKTTPWWKWGWDMVATDLAAAGIPRVLNGRSFDFHALRGQFATDLDREGVTMIRAQRMMRLSNPLLLSKHYSKPDAAAIREDVNKLQRGPAPKAGPKRGRGRGRLGA